MFSAGVSVTSIYQEKEIVVHQKVIDRVLGKSESWQRLLIAHIGVVAVKIDGSTSKLFSFSVIM